MYIDVTAGPEGVAKGEILIESPDSDDVRNNYRIGLPVLEPNEHVSLIGYTKPSSLHAEIIVTVKIGSNDYYHKENFGSVAFGDVLYLAIGSRLPALRKALAPPTNQAQGEGEEDIFAKDSGPRRLAVVDDWRQLPTRWFGYDPVDLLILTTGNRDFLTSLLGDRENRKEALAEWVRRGGRMVITTSRNQDVMAALDSQLGILPVTLAGTNPVPRLDLGILADVNQRILNKPTEVAKLEAKPGREFERLLPSDPKPGEPLLVVRGAYGLGQVTLVAFDPDQPPISTFGGQVNLWDRLLKHLRPADFSATVTRATSHALEPATER